MLLRLGVCLQDGEEPITVREAAAGPAKKGSKARVVSAEVAVKDDWLTEHASQVARMLPGGARHPSL